MGNVVSPAPEQLKASIISSGKILLSKTVDILAGSLGNNGLPTVTAKAFVLEPSEPGRRSGKHIQFTDLDVGTILNILHKAGIEDSAEWNTAGDFVQAYIDSSKIKPALYGLHDVGNHYLWPLLSNYLQGVDVLLYGSPRVTVGLFLHSALTEAGTPR